MERPVLSKLMDDAWMDAGVWYVLVMGSMLDDVVPL